MATANFSITDTTEGSNWSGQILGISGDNSVITRPTSGIYLNDAIQFGVSGFSNIPVNYNGGVANGSYFTIRQYQTSPSNPQYPYQGFSIDIWSEQLTDAIAAIAGGPKWDSLASGGPYNLSTAKFSLVYDHDRTYAPFWSKGGTISFTITS
jgi:hypothetical protein